jgi:multiple sugar transport system permease protein
MEKSNMTQQAAPSAGELKTLPISQSGLKHKKPGSWFDRNAHILFPAPAVILMFVIVIFPIIYTIFMSVQQWNITSGSPPKFIGLDNYFKILFDDSRFREALVRTGELSLLAVTLQTILGVSLALLFNREFWGRGILRTLAILPMVATPVAVSLIFVIMYHPTLGVMNYFVTSLGLPANRWTYDAGTVLPALAIVDTWQWTPLIMLIVLAGLATLSVEQFEAARIDGASRFQTFLYITLPQLRSVIIIAIVFRLIDSLKTFDIIFVMTGGGPGEASQTLNLYLYSQAFTYFDMGYASALVVIFFSIILGITVLVMKLRRSQWR